MMILSEAQPETGAEPSPVPPPVPFSPPESGKTSSRKIIVAIVLVVIVAGAGGFAFIYTQTNLLRSSSSASTQPNAGYSTYSNHGFSFQYLKTWTITERGLQDSTANDNSGIVIADNPSSQTDLVLVGWLHSVQNVDPSTVLPSAINGFQNGSGGSGLVMGQTGTAHTKAGYTVPYQEFSITVSGNHIDGVWSAWYSTHGQRLYQLSVVGSAQDSVGILSSYNTYLSSFVEQ